MTFTMTLWYDSTMIVIGVLLIVLGVATVANGYVAAEPEPLPVCWAAGVIEIAFGGLFIGGGL